jgi:hypothetical protein
MDQMDIERAPGNYADVTVFRLKGPFTLATLFPFQTALRDPSFEERDYRLKGSSVYGFRRARCASRALRP